MGNILWISTPLPYGYAFWNPIKPAPSLAYSCYRFTLSRSKVIQELVLSLFSLRLGVFMFLSSWLILLGSIQLLFKQMIWNVWSNILYKGLNALGKVLLAMIVYEFIIMKFPHYIKDVMTMELCVAFPYTPNEEIASGVGTIVTVTACLYFGLSVQFSRTQHQLEVKAASYDIAIEELNIRGECVHDEPPEGYQFVQAINNKAKSVLQEKIKQMCKMRKPMQKVTTTTTTTSTNCVNPNYPCGDAPNN